MLSVTRNHVLHTFGSDQLTLGSGQRSISRLRDRETITPQSLRTGNGHRCRWCRRVQSHMEFEAIDNGIEAVVAPPAPYLPSFRGLADSRCVLKTYQRNEQAPHTGEIAASMLTDFGCQYVLVDTPSDAKIRGRLMPSWRRRRSAPRQWA